MSGKIARDRIVLGRFDGLLPRAKLQHLTGLLHQGNHSHGLVRGLAPWVAGSIDQV